MQKIVLKSRDFIFYIIFPDCKMKSLASQAQIFKSYISRKIRQYYRVIEISSVVKFTSIFLCLGLIVINIFLFID